MLYTGGTECLEVDFTNSETCNWLSKLAILISNLAFILPFLFQILFYPSLSLAKSLDIIWYHLIPTDKWKNIIIFRFFFLFRSLTHQFIYSHPTENWPLVILSKRTRNLDRQSPNTFTHSLKMKWKSQKLPNYKSE